MDCVLHANLLPTLLAIGVRRFVFLRGRKTRASVLLSTEEAGVNYSGFFEALDIGSFGNGGGEDGAFDVSRSTDAVAASPGIWNHDRRWR